MMTKYAVLIVALLTSLVPALSFAQKLGDSAPQLSVKEWIKGNPVKIEPGTNIYVLVFCELSRANEFAITNMSSLQKIYRDKGVIVVAISGEAVEPLKAFMQFRGANIDFSVAADDEARRTTAAYQRVFKQMLLPRAYIVGKDGKVLWVGHPLRDGMGQVVDEITSGRYNLEQTQKAITARGQMEQYLTLARQDDPRTYRAGRMVLAFRTNDLAGLSDLAFQIATDSYIERRDVALASEALDQAEKLSPTNTSRVTLIRAILLFQTGKEEEGLTLAKKALESASTNDDKEEAQSNLRAMEAHLAASRTNQIVAPPKP